MPWSSAAARARSGRREQIATVSKSAFSRSAERCSEAPKPVPMTPTRIGSLGAGLERRIRTMVGSSSHAAFPGVTEERPGDRAGRRGAPG